MLLDVILACAPVAVAAPAAIALRTGHLSWASTGRLQKRLYQALLLAEKLPAGVPGSAQITTDVERQTLQVAYRAQYPQRAGDRRCRSDRRRPARYGDRLLRRAVRRRVLARGS